MTKVVYIVIKKFYIKNYSRRRQHPLNIIHNQRHNFLGNWKLSFCLFLPVTVSSLGYYVHAYNPAACHHPLPLLSEDENSLFYELVLYI